MVNNKNNKSEKIYLQIVMNKVVKKKVKSEDDDDEDNMTEEEKQAYLKEVIQDANKIHKNHTGSDAFREVTEGVYRLI